MNSKDLFDATRSSKIKFSDALNKQNEFLNKLNDVKFGRKNLQQKEVIDNLENFYKSREETINFLETILKYYQMQITMLKETEGKGLELLTSKQMLQRLPIALAQVKAGNNSENLLNEIRRVIYSVYQSKEIAKKVYNNLMKSL